MVCLPESFAHHHGPDIISGDFHENIRDGVWFNRYKELALENQVWLSMGSFPVTARNGKCFYQTHFIINQEGNVVSSYRKMHLFDVSLEKQGGVN